MTTMDFAKELSQEMFSLIDENGDALVDDESFIRNFRSKGIGSNGYYISASSGIKELKEFLDKETFDASKASLISLVVIICVSDGEICYPAALPKDKNSYVPYNGSSCWTKVHFTQLFELLEEKHASYRAEVKEGLKKKKGAPMKKKTVTDSDDENEETPTIKTRAVTAVKKAGKKALVRKVSRRLSNNVSQIAQASLAANPALAGLLASPVGQAVVPALLAVGLEFIPLPESIRDQIEPFKDLLVEELTAQAFDDGTAPLEEMVAFLLPALKDAMVPLLASGGKEILQMAQSATAPTETIKATLKE